MWTKLLGLNPVCCSLTAEMFGEIVRSLPILNATLLGRIETFDRTVGSNMAKSRLSSAVVP